MQTGLKLFFLFISGIICYRGNSQTRLTVNEYNFYTLHDSVKDIVYSFDSGSYHSNLFDRGKFTKRFGGISLIQNANGRFKLIRKNRIKEEVSGLGFVKTNANVLTNENFSEENCLKVDLLFGTRVMKKRKLHFDNKNNTFESLDTLPEDIDTYRKLELNYNLLTHCYNTVLEINGKKEKFLVDTGYSGQILVQSDENLRKRVDTYSYYSLVAFEAQEIKMNEYSGNSISHNGIEFNNNVVYCYDSYSTNMIGNAFFLNFEDVIFDFKGKCIYLRNERERFNPVLYDILFSADDEGAIRIAYLKHSGEYFDKGFRVGDKVVLEDKELEQRLTASPCDALKILKDWIAANGSHFEFFKSS